MMVDSDSSVSQKTAQPPEQSLIKITVRTSRIVWCKEKDSLLLDLYARSMPEKVGYVKRLHAAWTEKHPDLKCSANALATRLRRVKASNGP